MESTARPAAGTAAADVESHLAELIPLLSEKLPLTRERALKQIDETLANGILDREETTLFLLEQISQLAAQDRWESRQSAFKLADSLIKNGYDTNVNRTLVQEIRSHIEDEEPRVRLAVADLIHTMAVNKGAAVWGLFGDQLLEIIERCFERDETPAVIVPDRELGTLKKTPLMHDTEGWKSLETAVKSVLSIIQGCGTNFASLCTTPFINLVFKFLSHKNRFVRENGFYLCAAISEAVDENTLAEQIGPAMAPKLADGMIDDWNQVVRAAAMAVRAFMTHLNEHHLDSFWQQMLPAMCFHRHNTADGIKFYSQDTWCEVLKTNGRARIAQFINETVDYYTTQGVNDDNTNLKEASCYAIGELATKIDPAAVRPHVSALFSTLLQNLEHHNTWAVIDAACLSTTDLILNFPEECRADLPHAIELLSENISHVVWSVRENAAIALGAISRKFPDLIPMLEKRLRQWLIEIGNQPVDEHIDLETESSFGPSAKKRRDNNYNLHRGQEIFGCDCHSTKHLPGCGQHALQLQTPRQPWHAADGAIYLLRELISLDPARFAPIVSNELVTVAECPPTFAHYHHLMETLWRQIPRMIDVLKQNGMKLTDEVTKKAFARFLGPLGSSLKSRNRLVMSAGAAASPPLVSIVGQQTFVSAVALQKDLRKSDPSAPSSGTL